MQWVMGYRTSCSCEAILCVCVVAACDGVRTDRYTNVAAAGKAEREEAAQ